MYTFFSDINFKRSLKKQEISTNFSNLILLSSYAASEGTWKIIWL